MKKVLKGFVLAVSVLAMAATAQAANVAQVTLTTPAIAKLSGCEQVGSITLIFDQGTTLTEGDWFYFDLPTGTSVCSTIDYMIAAGRTAGSTSQTITYPSVANGVNNVDLAGGLTAIPALAPGASSGPLTNNIASGTGAALINGSGGVVLRFYAQAGGRRGWVYVYGTTAALDTLTVQNVATNNSTLSLHLLDGQRYSGNVILNKNSNSVWGDSLTDDIGLNGGSEYLPAHNTPNPEDTLCVNAASMSGSLMYISFNSYNAFLTFTGDSQFAHQANASSISLKSCHLVLKGNIPIGSSNNCSFSYGAGTGYCASDAANPFNFNHLLLNGTSTFGDPWDRYDMTLSLSSSATGGAGVYWGGATAPFGGFTPSQSNSWCSTVFGTSINYVSNATGFDTGTCTVAAANRATTLSTNSSGAIGGIYSYDTLLVELPKIVYDKSMVGNGVEATVTVTLTKYPCGTIMFTGSQVIGAFVSTCPVAGSPTLSDARTGLMWQAQDDNTPKTWEAALTYCEGLSLGGYTDWRLPNNKDLESISDSSRYNPAINTTNYPGTTAAAYWTSTTSANTTTSAWYVNFLDGTVNFAAKTGSNRVRCVRGGL